MSHDQYQAITCIDCANRVWSIYLTSVNPLWEMVVEIFVEEIEFVKFQYLCLWLFWWDDIRLTCIFIVEWCKIGTSSVCKSIYKRILCGYMQTFSTFEKQAEKVSFKRSCAHCLQILISASYGPYYNVDKANSTRGRHSSTATLS